MCCSVGPLAGAQRAAVVQRSFYCEAGMAIEWYYQLSGQQLGPLTSRQLATLASSGRLQPDDLVRRSGDDRWRPARRVRGLTFGIARPIDSSESTSSAQPTAIAPLF